MQSDEFPLFSIQRFSDFKSFLSKSLPSKLTTVEAHCQCVLSLRRELTLGSCGKEIQTIPFHLLPKDGSL